tara:strand:- start:2282 stop:2731 length:450 start_codon:yes stop_codon:yes gene_type:complete
MTLNYAKHEEEFYGVFKLVNGEEVLGRAVLTKDEGQGSVETLVFLQDPVAVHIVQKPLDENKMARGIGFAKWQQLSDEDFYILREKDIITVSSMSKDVIFMYETFINGEDGAAAKKAKLNLDPDKHKSIGFIGKVEEYRSKLEDLFKSS